MRIKTNCKYNDQDIWCTNKGIKRSFFGISSRCCLEYKNDKCALKEKRFKREGIPPKPIV